MTTNDIMQMTMETTGKMDELFDLMKSEDIGRFVDNFRNDNNEFIELMEEAERQYLLCIKGCFSEEEKELTRKFLEEFIPKLECHVGLLKEFDFAVIKWLNRRYSRLGEYYVRYEDMKKRYKTVNHLIKVLKSGKSMEQIESIMDKYSGDAYRWKTSIGKRGMEAVMLFYREPCETGRIRALHSLTEFLHELEAVTMGEHVFEPIQNYKVCISDLREKIEFVVVARNEAKNFARCESQMLKELKKMQI